MERNYTMIVDAETIDRECRALAVNTAKNMTGRSSFNPVRAVAALLQEMRELSGKYPPERVINAVTAYYDTMSRYGVIKDE